MRITTYSGSVTTTGSAGSATGTATINVEKWGFLEWVYLDYNASAPATTDVTIAHGGTPPGGNIVVRSNSATDGVFYVRGAASDVAAAAVTNSFVRIPVGGPVTVSVAQCDALTGAVTVYLGVADR